MALLCNAFYMSVGLLIRGVPDMKLWTSLLGYVDPRAYIDPVEAVPGLVAARQKNELHPAKLFSLTNSTDKKNENKEVAVNDFLGAESAVEAIGHSMDLYASFVVESLRR
jgi:hypothetical protein